MQLLHYLSDSQVSWMIDYVAFARLQKDQIDQY